MRKFIVVFVMVLLAVVSFAVVFGGLFFSMKGFFNLLGVTYESNGALVLFALYCLLIGIIFEVIELIFVVLIEQSALKVKVKSVWVIIVKLGLSWLLIHIVNDLMTSVTLSGVAEFLTAALITCVDVVFNEEKSKKKQSRR